MTSLYRFRSQDGRYGLTLPSPAVTGMRREAQNATGRETGGILVGLYSASLDTAIVTSVEVAPVDSAASRSSFSRGVSGIQTLLNRLWHQPVRTYYLGEWHVHPGFSPEKSAQDDATMQSGRLHDAFHCAVPVLVILGGDPSAIWTLRAWAYPQGQTSVPLREQGDV